jgi:hypothetical protein
LSQYFHAVGKKCVDYMGDFIGTLASQSCKGDITDEGCPQVSGNRELQEQLFSRSTLGDIQVNRRE